jgi:pimeloyl-ACP methyl ester carboxylesterase
MSNFHSERHIRIGNAFINMRSGGCGPALVLLHGYPLDSRTWLRIFPLLSTRFTCYAFDIVGLGKSSSSRRQDYGSQGQAALLSNALTSLGVSAYVLLGNDSGGWIARELALQDSARVSQLILTNTEIPFHRPPWIGLYQALARIFGGRALFRALLKSRTWRNSSMGFAGCFQNQSQIEGSFFHHYLAPLIDSDSRLRHALTFLREMDFARVDLFRELHGRMTMPVALIWGGADPTFPEALAREMAGQFPNLCRFLSISDGKLFMHEEMPDAVAEAIFKCMSSCRISAA